MEDAANEILDLITYPTKKAGELTDELIAFAKEHPGATAGAIVVFARKVLSGQSIPRAAIGTGIGLAAGIVLEEIIKSAKKTFS